MREALLLDLGAIIFELHRQRRREPELLQAKAAELDAVDAEVRALSLALEDGRGLPELTASGLVATCTACGSLMGSGDRFCPHCGAAAGAVLPPSGNGSEAPELEEGAADEEAAAAAEDLGEGRTPAEEEEPAPGSNQSMAHAEASARGAAENGSAPRAQDDPRAQDELVKLAQSKMRAGRRVARRWLAQRRPETR
jgi:hypothetical protein